MQTTRAKTNERWAAYFVHESKQRSKKKWGYGSTEIEAIDNLADKFPKHYHECVLGPRPLPLKTKLVFRRRKA